MQDVVLEQVAQDLTTLTSVPWSFKPVLSAPGHFVKETLDWLKAEGAISGYRNGSTFLRAGESDAFREGRPIAVDGVDAVKLRAMAAKAEADIQAVEKAAHLLGLLTDTARFQADPRDIVREKNKIRLSDFPPAYLGELKQLQTEGLANFGKLTFSNMEVKLLHTDGIAAKIDPQAKEVAGILNLFGTISGYPWTYYPRVQFAHPESTASEIMQGVEELKKAGAVDYRKTGKRHEDVAVTVHDMDALRTQGRARLEALKAQDEAEAIVGFLVGKTADQRWFYNLDRQTTKPAVDNLAASGAIKYQTSGLDDDNRRPFSFYLESFDLGKLRAQVNTEALHRNREIAKALDVLANYTVSTVTEKYDWNKWHYTPEGVYKASRRDRDVTPHLEKLHEEGLIGSISVANDRISVTVPDVARLKAKAEEAYRAVDRNEDVRQVLKAALGDAAVYSGGSEPTIRLDYVNGASMKPLADLRASRSIDYNHGHASIEVMPVNVAKLTAHLEPQLAAKDAAYQDRAEAVRLLGIAATGEPWPAYYHIKGNGPEVESGLMRRESAEYKKLDALKQQGAITFDYPAKPGPNGEFVPITIVDRAKLREATREDVKQYGERQEVAGLLRTVTGFPLYTSYGRVQGAYEYDEPVRAALEGAFKTMKTSGVIDYEHSHAGRDEMQDHLIVTSYNLGKLREYAAEVKAGGQGPAPAGAPKTPVTLMIPVV